MGLVVVSGKIKGQLEALKDKHELKSIDGVIRYLLDGRIRISGGIFLGTKNRQAIDIHNIPSVEIVNCFTDLNITESIEYRFLMCLDCGLIIIPPKEWIVNSTINLPINVSIKGMKEDKEVIANKIYCICGKKTAFITINIKMES